MEEENKVVAEEEQKQEVVQEEQPKQEVAESNQQNESMDEDSKYSLITFILACVGLVVCAGWIVGGLACAVLGLIALGRVKNCKAVRQPFRTFDRISKPVAIVDVVLGFVVALAYTIKLIIDIVEAIQKALS